MDGKERKEKRIYVSHVNVRLSISFLVLKLVLSDLLVTVLFAVLYFSLNAASSYGTIGSGIGGLSFAGLLFLSIIEMLISVYVVLEWLNEYYEIMPHYIIYKRGLIFKKIERYNFQNIKKIEIFQGVFGRILNYGDLQLFDWRLQKYAGMYQIHNPMKYLHILEELLPNIDEQTALVREHIIERE